MTMPCLLCNEQVIATHDALAFHFGAFHPETKPFHLGPRSHRAELVSRMEGRLGSKHFI